MAAKNKVEEKAAEEKAAEEKTGLVTMTKDGAELAVDPSCVAAHEDKGWVAVDA